MPSDPSPQTRASSSSRVTTLPACWKSASRTAYSRGVSATGAPSSVTSRRAASSARRPTRAGSAGGGSSRPARRSTARALASSSAVPNGLAR